MEKFRDAIDRNLSQISVGSFQQLADDNFRKSFDDLVRRNGADAGAIWIVEHDNPQVLTIAVNVGEKGDSIEGEVQQVIETGLVSRAYKDKEFVHDQGAFRNAEQSDSVDRQLGQFTAHQMALPFNVFGNTVGAVTLIQLATPQNVAGREWGFNEAAENSFQCWTSIAQQLIEWAVVRDA